MLKSTIKHLNIFLLMLAPIFLTGCGSSSNSEEDDIQIPTSSMTAKIKVEPLTRLVSGQVTVAEFTATAIHIHDGAAGSDGPIIFTLQQDATNADRWTIPQGSRLSGDQYTKYLADGIYFNAHSTANPTGEVREQISAKTINTSNVTFDENNGNVTGYVMISGFIGTAAHIHTEFAGASGGVSVTLEADATTVGKFNLPNGATVSVSDYNMGKLYFNIHSAEFGAGQIREQIEPDGIQIFAVKVSGEQVVPTEVADGGSGIAYVTVNETSGELNVTMDLHNIDDATAAHIHAGVDGTTGGILQSFSGASGDTSWTISGVTLSTTADLDQLLAGETYINVHSISNGGGEARGQIIPEDVTVVSTTLSADEAQTAGTNASGTSAGSAKGYVTVNENVTPATIRANLIFSGVTPTAAHIHNASGIVFTLTLDLLAGTASAMGTLDATQLDEFESDMYYFNLHTADNPGGELRGQIKP